MNRFFKSLYNAIPSYKKKGMAFALEKASFQMKRNETY